MNDQSMPVPRASHYDLVPFDQVKQMAAAIAESGLFGMKTPAQALALMLVAQAEGQHPATVTQEYDIIQGRAARKTNSVLARFQQAGGSVEWHELTDKVADATFTPPQRAGKPLRLSWTVEQAKAAKLVEKDNWRGYPRAMLRARCIAEGVRAVYPAAIGGMLVVEEAQDLPTIDVTPGKPEVQMPQESVQPRQQVEGEAKPIEGVVETAAEQKGQAAKGGSGKPAPASLLSMIHKKMEQAERSETEVCTQFGIPMLDSGDSLAGITLEQGNAILAWLRNPAEAAK
jgi:hypothetical protein